MVSNNCSTFNQHDVIIKTHVAAMFQEINKQFTLMVWQREIYAIISRWLYPRGIWFFEGNISLYLSHYRAINCLLHRYNECLNVIRKKIMSYAKITESVWRALSGLWSENQLVLIFFTVLLFSSLIK